MSGFLRTGKRRNPKIWVTVFPSGKTIETSSGVNLLEALLAAGERIAHPCGRQARCGACHVWVRQGKRGLSKVREAERDRLAEIKGAGTLSRLACQAALGVHDIVVERVKH